MPPNLSKFAEPSSLSCWLMHPWSWHSSGARGKRSYCRRGQAASGGCHLKGIFDLLCEHFLGDSSDTYFSWTYFGRGHIHISKEEGSLQWYFFLWAFKVCAWTKLQVGNISVQKLQAQLSPDFVTSADLLLWALSMCFSRMDSVTKDFSHLVHLYFGSHNPPSVFKSSLSSLLWWSMMCLWML